MEFELELPEKKTLENILINLEFKNNTFSKKDIEEINDSLFSDSNEDEKKMEVEKSDTDNNFLPLIVHCYKGYPHNNKGSISHMLEYDNNEFLSNYPKPLFVFKHQYNHHMIIKKVII
jgi:hypothetical protein